MIETDVLVIGAGIAGGITALETAEAGAQVVLLENGRIDQSNTRWAQGGIIYTGPGDSPNLLASDVIEAGAGVSNPQAAYRLAEDGPVLVERLLIEKLQVPFDRRTEGELDITEEGAHSVPRIIHCKDATGQGIAEALDRALKEHPNIRRLRPWAAIDLLTLAHHSRNPLDIYEPMTCVGAYALDRKSGEVETILARETVLATGGLGELYLHTTNPAGARGDGIAMAYRAGARLINLEYVQFHPTALYMPPAPRFLISESMRGEGARLILRNGEEFMQRHHPQGSLAPRDVVARAIHQELMARGEPCVYLDLRHKDSAWIRERFPTIYERCLEHGIDITSQPIPVVPAAHYSCGGIATDLDGRTTMQGLWAVGEVACTGLHGANRLASTSLLEGLVFGWRTAQGIAAQLQRGDYRPWPPIDSWLYEEEPWDPALILQDWMTIKYTMWNYVGLARTHKRLQRAYTILRELQMEINEFYARARLDDDLIGLRNGVQAALAIVYAAMENRVSRGAHYLIPEHEAPPSMNHIPGEAPPRSYYTGG